MRIHGVLSHFVLFLSLSLSLTPSLIRLLLVLLASALVSQLSPLCSLQIMLLVALPRCILMRGNFHFGSLGYIHIYF